MSQALMAEIVRSLRALDGFDQRKHNKPISVKRPSWELLFAGRELDGNRWRNVWNLTVYGSRDDVPDAEARIMAATQMVSDAILPIPCLLIGDFARENSFPVVDPELGQAEDHGQALFTMASCVLKEA